ncbi:hypothetical protein [Algiphilus sp.]|uniref:hypothetical protein n=1 Tax=Algiphilus sp. TaxID=1872431 RepID=UPI0025C3A8EA|nr:hypothetical protein [Algiphilus sp.]MCK5770935.1 hypothetical protein [Algiphilus sp.]
MSYVPMDQRIVDELARIVALVPGIDDVQSEPYVSAPRVDCAVEIDDDEESGIQHSKGKRGASLNVKLRMFRRVSPSDDESPRASMRALLYAIRWRLAQCDIQQFPPGTREITVGGRTFFNPQEGSHYAMAEMPVSVQFSETFNEETQP